MISDESYGYVNYIQVSFGSIVRSHTLEIKKKLDEPDNELQDRWIISELNPLISDVDGHYSNYEPTKAARAISDFVQIYLSNWYVRLSRRRFWKGSYSQDKISAFQTLKEI